MNESEILEILERAEAAVERGDGLGRTGFWKAVGGVKADPVLADELRERIARIDRGAFEDWALLTIPAPVGTGLAVLATAAGLGAVAAAYSLTEPWNWISFGVGTAILMVSSHGLGHLVVGAASGIKFTHWFIGELKLPQPGVKVDYATYLATPARKRAWMHAAGAIVTKAIPFLLIPVAIGADLPGWVVWATLGAGVIGILTDIVWSVKASDWKKFRREMGYA